ncbi:hypothetical protein ACRRTK_021629 [Alexandromys fortis]
MPAVLPRPARAIIADIRSPCRGVRSGSHVRSWESGAGVVGEDGEEPEEEEKGELLSPEPLPLSDPEGRKAHDTECQVARPPRWCTHYTADLWCGPWWRTWGFPESKFVFGKGNYPADGEDQGICGHHVCVSEHGEDDSSDQGCYPACEGHEPLQHGTTEARILSTLRGLQLRCRQDTLELHVGSLQQDGSGSWLQPPRTLHPGRVSALLGHGLDKLKATLEESVLQATGWRGLTLCLQLGRPQLCCSLSDNQDQMWIQLVGGCLWMAPCSPAPFSQLIPK